MKNSLALVITEMMLPILKIYTIEQLPNKQMKISPKTLKSSKIG